MANKLQKRHGTAVITYINRHILAAEIPSNAHLGTGTSVRMQLGSRLALAFTLHLANQPITAATVVDAGGGSITPVGLSFAYFVRLKIFEVVVKHASHGAGRVHTYVFTDDFARKIEAIHNGVGLDDN
jgi:hypothetical protein